MDWRGKVAAVLLGFVAGGMAVNVLADAFHGKGVIAVAGCGAVLAVASWLRRLPPRAPIARHSSRLFLLAALGVAGFGPFSWAPWITAVATGLTAVAILTAADLATAATLLRGAAVVGVGVSLVAWSGDGMMDGGPVLVCVSWIAIGTAVTVLGAALTGADGLYWIALIGFGVGIIGLGADAAMEGNALSSWLLTVAAASMVVLGIAHRTQNGTVTACALTILGLTALAGGAGALIDEETLNGLLFTCLGFSLVGMGVSTYSHNEILNALARVGLGLPFVGFGIFILTNRDTLPGVAFFGLGVGLIGLGFTGLARAGVTHRMKILWDRATSETPDGHGLLDRRPAGAVDGTVTLNDGAPDEAGVAGHVGFSRAGPEIRTGRKLSEPSCARASAQIDGPP